MPSRRRHLTRPPFATQASVKATARSDGITYLFRTSFFDIERRSRAPYAFAAIR
jgi:hypothetical protein